MEKNPSFYNKIVLLLNQSIGITFDSDSFKQKLQKTEQYFCCFGDSDALQLRTADEREIFPKHFNSSMDFIL